MYTFYVSYMFYVYESIKNTCVYDKQLTFFETE